MGGGGHNVRIRYRRRVKPRGDKSRDVSHIDHEVSPALLCYLRHAREIDDPRVRRGSGNYQLRFHRDRLLLELVVINKMSLRVYAVGNEMIVKPRKVHRTSVGKMPAVGKAHSHNRVSGLKQGYIYRRVRLRAAVRLDVCVFCAEQLLCALSCDVLDNVNALTAAVIALSGVPFRIFVREDRSGSRKNRLRYEVFRRDKLYPVVLPLIFRKDRLTDLRVA